MTWLRGLFRRLVSYVRLGVWSDGSPPPSFSSLGARNFDIYNRLTAGQGMAEIGQRHNLSRERVRQIGELYGYKRTSKANTQARHERMLEMANMAGFDYHDIATELGLTPSYVVRFLRQNNAFFQFCIDCMCDIAERPAGTQRCDECATTHIRIAANARRRERWRTDPGFRRRHRAAQRRWREKRAALGDE